jgi:hypothetical protein
MDLRRLIDRDGSACLWCGRHAWPADLTAEHLLPRSRGGRGRDENLAVACRACNRRRGSRPVVAHVRAELVAGAPVALARINAALQRLAGSESHAHADYGRRQAALLARLDCARPQRRAGGKLSR